MPVSFNQGSDYSGINSNNYSHMRNYSNNNVKGDVSASSRNTSSYTGMQNSLSGQIVSQNGKDITILLDNNKMINAKLEGSANLSVGQTVTFEIKGRMNDTLTLRPLYSNLNTNPAASSALKAAGLPITDINLAFTNAMMKEGMPINRNALIAMEKMVATYPDNDPAAVVLLTKMGMPVNEVNVNQMSNYNNFEHQIINSVNNLSDGLAEVVSNAFGNSFEEGISLASDILNLIDADSLKQIAPSFEAKLGAFIPKEEVLDEIVSNNNLEKISNEEIINNENVDALGIITNEEDGSNQDGNFAQSRISSVIQNVFSKINNIVSDGTNNLDLLKNITESEVNSHLSLSPGEQDTLSGNLKELYALADIEDVSVPIDASKVLNIIRNIITELKNGIDLSKPVLDMMNQSNDEENVKEGVRESLTKLLSSGEFSKLLSDSLKSQWTLKPELVSNKDNVDKLYERISNQTDKIIKLLENAGIKDTNLVNCANSLSDNVSFMNQLNQFVNYVQIPLKMYNGEAHGELMVYTNKKNLKENGGNLSALLHLDMDNLGPLDVHIAMKNYDNVNTHFYVSDESVIDIIEANIHLLNDNLKSKGYNMNTYVSKKDTNELKPIAEEFTKEEDGSVQRKVSSFRFDVRA